MSRARYYIFKLVDVLLLSNFCAASQFSCPIRCSNSCIGVDTGNDVTYFLVQGRYIASFPSRILIKLILELSIIASRSRNVWSGELMNRFLGFHYFIILQFIWRQHLTLVSTRQMTKYLILANHSFFSVSEIRASQLLSRAQYCPICQQECLCRSPRKWCIMRWPVPLRIIWLSSNILRVGISLHTEFPPCVSRPIR